MKTENDFNRFLSAEIKRLSPTVFAFKSADKYGLGVPDYIIWGHGYSCVFESKFIQSLPDKPNTKILKHTFKRTQQSFMKNVMGASNPAWGIIGCKKNKIIYVIEATSIPESGNFTHAELQELIKLKKVKLFEFNDVEEMILHMLDIIEEAVYAEEKPA